MTACPKGQGNLRCAKEEGHRGRCDWKVVESRLTIARAPNGGLVLHVEEARQILAQCVQVDEVKQIRDQAGAVAAYMRQQRASAEAQNDAAEIKLRAERRLGELLAQQEKNKGGGDVKSEHRSQKARSGPPPLRELGISHTQSARWQDVAKVPEAKFEGFISETRAAGGEVTTSGLRREHVSEVKRQERVDKLVTIARGNKPLPVGATAERYPVIYADPPWQYDEGSATPNRQIENQYPTMSLEEIAALKVHELATPDAILYLWCPAPKLEEAFVVIGAWGFTYRTGMVWDKETIGPGYWARIQHEHLLIATRGEMPTPAPEVRPPSVLRCSRGEHSEKPQLFADVIQRAFPDLPRIELFARGAARPGWAVFGNQAESAA